ncbi:MAG: cation:proton antiporter [Acidimicrobiia bacterium]|jgi:multicomponent Na+:H+ antiporter subunit F|nr:cation:proton antiporter [Acidimicrobiia bacterium]
MTVVIDICLTLLVVAGGLCLLRLVRGESVADRVVALDALLVIIISGVAVDAASRQSGLFLDVLVVGALVAFTGTITVARYVERRGAR